MEHIIATWGYLALFGITMFAAFGIPLGSELAIAYSGVLAGGQAVAAHHDHLNLALVIAVAATGEVCGSYLGYSVGRFGGRALVDRIGRFVLLSRRDLDRADAWFERRGEPAVLLGRFVPFVRSFVSVAAGVGEMARIRFLVLTALACSIWCGALASIGYGLAASWHRVLIDFRDVGYLAALLAVLVVAGFFAHRVRVVRAERALDAAALRAES